MSVHRWEPAVDGPLSEEALRQRLERQGWSVSRYVYPPGTHFAEHTHAVDKIDAVISGRFEITLDGRSVVLEAGDWIDVPRGRRHSAAVVGAEAVVSLDAVRPAR